MIHAAGEYPQKIVDEVRTFEKPAWEEEVSSLDPVSDIDDFVQHGFNIPPEDYDEVQKIGKARLWKLEKLKAPLDSEDQAIVDARVDMVKHRSLDDVKWLKHKAYYRAMEKIRADKAAEEKAHREEYLASKGAPLDVVPAALIDAPSPMQQAAQARAAAGRSAAAAGAAEAVPEDISRFYKPVGASVAELIDLQRAAQPSETTEWEEGWDSMSYLHRTDARRWAHPLVLLLPCPALPCCCRRWHQAQLLTHACHAACCAPILLGIWIMHAACELHPC